MNGTEIQQELENIQEEKDRVYSIQPMSLERLNYLTKVHLCCECGVSKANCPYPAAHNSKELKHQACEKWKRGDGQP